MIAFSSGRAVPTMSAGGREEVREGRGGGWRMEDGGEGVEFVNQSADK